MQLEFTDLYQASEVLPALDRIFTHSPEGDPRDEPEVWKALEQRYSDTPHDYSALLGKIEHDISNLTFWETEKQLKWAGADLDIDEKEFITNNIDQIRDYMTEKLGTPLAQDKDLNFWYIEY